MNISDPVKWLQRINCRAVPRTSVMRLSLFQTRTLIDAGVKVFRVTSNSDGRNLGVLCREPDGWRYVRMAADWQVYKGPKGGSGWVNPSTGEVRSQKEKPGTRGEGEDAERQQPTKPTKPTKPGEMSSKLKAYAEKQGTTVEELASSKGFTGSNEMVQTASNAKAAGFKSLKEAADAKGVDTNVGADLAKAFEGGIAPAEPGEGKAGTAPNESEAQDDDYLAEYGDWFDEEDFPEIEQDEKHAATEKRIETAKNDPYVLKHWLDLDDGTLNEMMISNKKSFERSSGRGKPDHESLFNYEMAKHAIENNDDDSKSKRAATLRDREERLTEKSSAHHKAKPVTNEFGEITGYKPVTTRKNGDPWEYGAAPKWLLEQPITTVEMEKAGGEQKAIERRKRKGRAPVMSTAGIPMSIVRPVEWLRRSKCYAVPRENAMRLGLDQTQVMMRSGVDVFRVARNKDGRHQGVLFMGADGWNFIRLADGASPWQPYVGPKDGKGWVHSETGEVRHQEKRPGTRKRKAKPGQSRKYNYTADDSDEVATKKSIMEATKGLSDEHMVEGLSSADPAKFFEKGIINLGAGDIELSDDRNENALRTTYAQAKGGMGKRDPIKVVSKQRKRDDGEYVEYIEAFGGDSNSVVAIAQQAGWEELPVMFVGHDGKEIGHDQDALEATDLPRVDMPQIGEDVKDQFFDRLLSEKGVESVVKLVDPKTMRGTQAEFNITKVAGIGAFLRKLGKPMKNETIATRDGFILDGHHRWRAHHAAGLQLRIIEIDMTAAQAIDAMHRFSGSKRVQVDDSPISRAEGFSPDMATYLHSNLLSPTMQEAMTVEDYTKPIEWVQPMASEDEVIKAAQKNRDDYNKILNFGVGVSKSIGARTVDMSKEGARENLIKEIKAGKKGPVIVIEPLLTASEQGLEEARNKVADVHGGSWGKLRDVVSGTVSVDSLDDVPGAVAALRDHVKGKDWKISTRPIDKFSNPSGNGYRNLTLFIESPDGLQAEVKINTKATWLARETGGHQLYNQAQAVRRDINKNGSTPEKLSQIKRLDAQMRKLYRKADAASGGDEAKAKSTPKRRKKRKAA